MKILLTGASSFTGYWFAKVLSAAGHTVAVVLTQPPGAYTGIRAERVRDLTSCTQVYAGVRFGDEAFMNLLDLGWDLFANHGSHVTGYRDPHFDVAGALAINALNLGKVVERLKSNQCQSIVLTGTVFEGGEGSDLTGRGDVSPYGLCKRLTFEAFHYYCRKAGLLLQKFVVPNPFGPYEEQDKFTHYVMNSWFHGETALCKTPGLVRDNLHVSSLALSYLRCCEGGATRVAPSGYIETQGRFLSRMAAEVASRTGLACNFQCKNQTSLTEPYCRVNTDFLDHADWDELSAWDDYIAYHQAFARQPIPAARPET